jgi:nitric oxide reductase activation protein
VRTARGLGGAAALHGFSSNTRHAVRYERLLDFATAIDARALAHLHAVPARHSTRLGAALRHATRGLLARPEPRRLLLVLTDGAPSDVDVVDARHLVEDARHAVQAARRAEVDVMCLATASARLIRFSHWVSARLRCHQNGEALILCSISDRRSAPTSAGSRPGPAAP